MKHFLVAAMLMVSASCAAFNLQPNKVSEPFSWKWNWIQQEDNPIYSLICPVCGGTKFTSVRVEAGPNLWELVCLGCGWYIYAQKV